MGSKVKILFAQPTSTSCFVLLSCIAYTASSLPTLDECSGDEFGLKRPTNGPDARTYAGTTSSLAPIFRCEMHFRNEKLCTLVVKKCTMKHVPSDAGQEEAQWNTCKMKNRAP